ncbi:phosphosulfolactate synthase [Puia sp. P3]|uniref:phosphosulfolactate synthase n=1 Tax=Puia sp. P3 TaxID=3423952 RepID=UPI003D667F24
MNFHLSQIPERTARPRTFGLTMVNDKGLSVAEARHLVSGAGPHVDLVKLAFGTPLVTTGLDEKIRIFQDAGIPVYFGGLLFEAFVIRNQFDDFLALLKEYNITYTEVSDGSIDITHSEKCGYIEKLAKYGTVLSEIGSRDKDREHITPPYQWIQLMQAELTAGSSYIVAEARETGTVGIYRDSGEVREGLVQEILTKVPAEKILWEAPRKDQQLYFLQLVGANANLGNITPSEVIALEAMRIGLRGDTFDLFLKDS